VQFTKNSQDIGLRSDLKVDPSTLGMNIQLPLRVYAGRGGADLPITLYYSSKVWRLRYNGYYTGYVGTIGVDNLGNFSMARAMYGEDSAAGWTSSLDVPRIVHTDSIEEEVYNGNGRPCADTGVTGPSSPCYPANQRTVGRLRIRLPDGSIHELRKSDTVIFKTQSTGTGTYYAVDGSRLRYETQTATLYLPDGARYILGAELGQNTSQYIDRNGNTLTFTSAIGSAQPAGIWTDTAGRSVSLPPLDYSNNATRAVGDQSYTLRSVAGTNITYIFRWRRLNEVRTDGNQTLYYTGDKLCGGSYRQAFSPSLFASSGDGSSGSDTLVCGEEFNPVVLAEIVLPTGSSYKFTYNLFGEIDKVVYPTGGYERYGYAAVASLNPSGAPYDQANRGVSDRWVSTDGTITDENAHHWQYSTSGDVVNTMAPDGTHTRRLLRVGRQFSTVYFGFDDARAGMPYDEITYSATSQMVSRKLGMGGYGSCRHNATNWRKCYCAAQSASNERSRDRL
jgi:hypothetical protein